MYDLLHAMEGSEEEEGLRAHIIKSCVVYSKTYREMSGQREPFINSRFA